MGEIVSPREELLMQLGHGGVESQEAVVSALDKYLDARDAAILTRMEERLRQLRIGGL